MRCSATRQKACARYAHAVCCLFEHAKDIASRQRVTPSRDTYDAADARYARHAITRDATCRERRANAARHYAARDTPIDDVLLLTEHMLLLFAAAATLLP